ncbi:hypothetical protein GCM10010280_57090 [Streptomyces pilosus]|uniref:Uncharacterized protein n=1 Tax=Streptomyces pilosus TaxID=28893 RepID=A0A918C140_9ACTN|nr:hypothetical protein GCM10010280_57090 [Streptomyces pilosus]
MARCPIIVKPSAAYSIVRVVTVVMSLDCSDRRARAGWCSAAGRWQVSGASAAGGPVAVAEDVNNDAAGESDELLSDGSTAGSGGRDPDLCLGAAPGTGNPT